MDIDFAFDPKEDVDNGGCVDFGPHAIGSLKAIEWKGHKILVPPPELHILPNRRRKRMERVTLIEEYLRDNTQSGV